MNSEVIKKIEDLFMDWYSIHMIASISTWGKDEYDTLINYCKEHKEDFREFAKDTLAHPQFLCHTIPDICCDVLPDEVKKAEPIYETDYTFDVNNILEKISRKICCITNWEDIEWELCNDWLNYFNGTKDIDYYKDYKEFRKYEEKHFIPWCPNKEEDPNPTYEEFIANREKYKI